MANIINNKELKLHATTAWNEMYGGLEARYYITLAVKALRQKPVDMLVFENVTEDGQLKMQVRCAGYDLNGSGELDETTTFFKDTSLEIKNFWLKLDDYGDHYVGTMLFPEEY
jgi:hypothetical protein